MILNLSQFLTNHFRLYAYSHFSQVGAYPKSIVIFKKGIFIIL